MPDLLDTLGKDAEAKAQASDDAAAAKADNDMLDGDPKKVDTTTVDPTPPTDEGKSTKKTDEPAEDDPYKDWTPKDFEKALKDARKDAGKYRTKAKDLEDQMDSKLESKLREIDDKYAPLKKKADELDKLKAEQEDKKRDMSQKLAHRESLIRELEEKLEEAKNLSHKEKVALQEELTKTKGDLEGHLAYYREQLDKELDAIPAQWKEVADAMVKGTSDTREALALIRDAKNKNFFGDKKVDVYHGAPKKASEGARMSSTPSEDQKKDMKSKDKIKAGLKGLVSEVKTTRGKFGI